MIIAVFSMLFMEMTRKAAMALIRYIFLPTSKERFFGGFSYLAQSYRFINSSFLSIVRPERLAFQRTSMIQYFNIGISREWTQNSSFKIWTTVKYAC